jgi:hypothetical protein
MPPWISGSASPARVGRTDELKRKSAPDIGIIADAACQPAEISAGLYQGGAILL